MTLKSRSGGQDYTISCDNSRCSKEETYYTNDWHKALSKAKGDGWLPRKIDDEWGHYCDQGCFEEMR